jgi:hypothetical protein
MSALVYSLGFQGVYLVGVPVPAKPELGAGGPGVGLLYGASDAGALVGTPAVGAFGRGAPGACCGAEPGRHGRRLRAGRGGHLPRCRGRAARARGRVRGVCAVAYLTVVQAHTPPAVRGRVTGLLVLCAVGLAPLSLGIGGLMNDVPGSRGTFGSGGLAMGLAGLCSLGRRAFRAAA